MRPAGIDFPVVSDLAITSEFDHDLGAGIDPQNVEEIVLYARFCGCSYGFTTSRIRWRSEKWRGLWIMSESCRTLIMYPWRIHGAAIYGNIW